LGDRKAPTAFTPGLILTSDDPETPPAVAPLAMLHDTTALPATMSVECRAKLTFPFESIGEGWSTEVGHVLPSTLEDSDSGLKGSCGAVVCVTWQRLRHDSKLAEEGFSPQIMVLTDALHLTSHPGRLVKALHLLRTRFPEALLYCPAISGPDNLALLTWFGVDLHDLGRSRQAASAALLLTASGPRQLESSVEEEAGLQAQLRLWQDEIATVRAAIRAGSLRELVEKRALNSARSVEHLRHHDLLVSNSKSAPLARHMPARHVLRCHSSCAAEAPLIRDWTERMATEYQPPSQLTDLLILLPCSARKPYSSSSSHRRFRRAIGNIACHEVMVTSPLGLVPRELEELWPAAHYDIPVTGNWDVSESDLIRTLLLALIERGGYRRLIDHSGLGLAGMQLGLVDVEIRDTRRGLGASSKAALKRLSAEVKSAVEDLDLGRLHQNERDMIRFRSMSRWLHGTDEWLSNCRVRGRHPRRRLEADGVQLAQWDPTVARFSFSKAALPVLHQTAALPVVDLSPDNVWKGDLFTGAVLSHQSEIRLGDELIVLQNGRLVGSARAVCAGWEWERTPGRLGKARHRV
jgi:archaeosine synthase